MINRNTQAKDFSDAIDTAMNSVQISSYNPFPVEVFPKIFQDLIIDLRDTLNYPIDYTGTAILTAIATTIGTTAKVKVKNNWFEYASLYTCIIGNAGANKTHPINTIFTPIRNIDAINHTTYTTNYNESLAYQKLSKKEKQEQTEVLEPVLSKSILTNFTPEVLNKRLAENVRGCTVLSDEMTTFFEGMNNYSKGDQLGVYLSFWSNQPTTIDRIGNPIPLFIQNPYLSIIGGLQPRMLSSAFPVVKLNNGFFQRFLFAFPEATLKTPINDNNNNQLLFDNYSSFIKEYFETFKIEKIDGNINSKILNWNAGAKAFFYDWQTDNCDKVNEYQNNIKGEIISKYDNHFVRLALLLQLMKDPYSTEIEIDAVKGAKLLCTYFMNCSFTILAIIQNPIDYLNTLTSTKKQFYSFMNDSFTTAEAIENAKAFDIHERRVKDFLNDTVLFKKVKHGFYQKTIKINKE